MSPSSVAPVLVVGSGPSGLAAALALLQNNIPVRIIDKEPHYRIGQRGSGIWPRTFEVFHFLQAHDIHKRSATMLPMCEYKAGMLEPVKTFQMTIDNDPTPAIPYNSPRLIGQPVLEALLRAHLKNYGCDVELATKLQSFEDDGQRVLAQLVKTTGGIEITETFEASYLIGADGAKGVTRKRLGLSFIGETKDDLVSVTGDICLEAKGIDREHFHVFCDSSANVLFLRPTNEISPDGFQFMLSRKDIEPKKLLADEKLMLRSMSETAGREISVRKVVFVSEYRPNVRMVDKFHIGRVFVAGDAAHVHSPTGGQGLNTSVQDAFNLAWKLSLVCKGLSPVTLLDSYTTERLPVVAEMLGITTGYLNQLAGKPSIEGAMKREKRLDMLGVNCRSSPIVLDEFTQAAPVSAYGVLEDGVLVAGDRAPDAPGLVVVTGGSPGGLEVGAETRFFDLFNPTYHTVVVFSPDAASAADVLDTLKRYPEQVIRALVVFAQSTEVPTAVARVDTVVDRDGHAYRAYLATKGQKKVVIVRPDGVVGAMVHSADGVEAYFSKIFL